MIDEQRYDTAEALAEATALAIAEALRTAVAERGRASLVVSGGRTPEALFRVLARQELPWDRVDIGLADERWLPPEHADSNERMVRHSLLTGPAAAARFLSLKTAAASPAEAVPELGARLNALARPFDAVILGMGEDGHTASLFPCAPELAEVLAAPLGPPVAALTPRSAPHARLSLTPSALTDARAIWLLLVGARKWAVYQEALADVAAVAAMPVRLVLGQDRVPVHLAWAPA